MLSRIGKVWSYPWREGKRSLNALPMNRKRRTLVLTNEAAHHPFRASLPPAMAKRRKASRWQRLTRSDARDFATAFFATFVVVSVFIG